MLKTWLSGLRYKVRQKKRWEDDIKLCTRAENRTKWKGIDAKSSVVPKVMGYNRIEQNRNCVNGVKRWA